MQFVFKLPSTVVSTIITFSTLRHTGDAASYQVLFIALNALAFLGTAVVAPVSMVASCIYYYSLKERKDHAGLIQNIDNIGVQPARTETEIKRDEGDF
jgi:Na+/melibiose symporter-like transporter